MRGGSLELQLLLVRFLQLQLHLLVMEVVLVVLEENVEDLQRDARDALVIVAEHEVIVRDSPSYRIVSSDLSSEIPKKKKEK